MFDVNLQLGHYTTGESANFTEDPVSLGPSHWPARKREQIFITFEIERSVIITTLQRKTALFTSF